MTKCKDINGNDICRFILQENGTVLGVLCDTGTMEEAPKSTYKGLQIYQQLGSETYGTPNQECCERFGYEFDNNVCYWSRNICEPAPEFTIVMDANGNEGAFFDVDEGESCILNVNFEYLFEFNCDDLLGCMIAKDDGELEAIAEIQILIDETEQCIETQQGIIDDLLSQQGDIIEATGTTNDTLNDTIGGLQEQINDIEQALIELREESPSTSTDAQIKIKESQKKALANKQNEAVKGFGEYNLNLQGQFNFIKGELGQAISALTECQETLTQLQLELSVLQQELATDSPRIIDMFRGLDVCITLEKIVPTQSTGSTQYVNNFTTETIYEEQLFNIGGIELATDSFVEYLQENEDTGFLFTGGDCETVINAVLLELGNNCDLVNENTFNSNWLTHSFTIADEATLSAITNQQIKLGIKVKNCECDFAFLIDKIEFNRVCSKVKRKDIVVNECPGFELVRECDNKKSWVALDEFDNRTHDLTMRLTDYNTNHHKLVINTKEVDLDVNIARGIETDVWCYMSDNPCLLSGCVDIDIFVTGSTGPFFSGVSLFKGELTNIANVTLSGHGLSSGTVINISGSTTSFNTTVAGFSIIESVTGDSFTYRTNGTSLSTTATSVGDLTVYTAYSAVTGVSLTSSASTITADLGGVSTDCIVRITDVVTTGITALLYPTRLDNDTTSFATGYATVDSTSSSAFTMTTALLSLTAVTGTGTVTFYCPTAYSVTSGDTLTTCEDLTDLLSIPVSATSTVKEFKELICSELIDAKAHKVMGGYPVLGEIYDRYINSELYCDQKSSAFGYESMMQFAGLVGNYWVDLIEQVIPATTIWGSTYVIENTCFHKQKFTYKRYSLFTCDEPTNFPFSAIGYEPNVDVVTIDVSAPEIEGLPDCLVPSGRTETCSGVWNMQIDDGSEFIGTVTIVSSGDPTDEGDTGGGNPDSTPNTDTGPVVIISEADPTITNLRQR